MSEPTGPVCPECGTPRAADGTPACSCARRASDAHRESRTAEAAAAEDFDPVRIRPFVEVGDEPADGDGPETLQQHSISAELDQEGARLHGEATARASSEAVGEPLPRRHPADDGAQGSRRRRKVLATGAGAAATVLVTGAFVGGLFSYQGPTRDGSGAGGVRAGLPQEPSAPVPPSRTGTGTSPAPSTTSPASPSSPTPVTGAATPSGATGRPTGTPSTTTAPTATAAPAPTSSHGRPPVLRLGDKGPEVVELQLRLHQIGLYGADADGDYDSGVQSAVRGYQITRFIVDDESGVYGAATRASLESETTKP